MNEAIRIYLSDMSESAKLEAIRAEFLPLATMLDAITGSDIVYDWTVTSDDLAIESAFFKAGWIG